MKPLIVALFTSSLLLTQSAGFGAEIGKAVYNGNASIGIRATHRIEVQFKLFDTQFVGLFEGLRITDSDVGRTFYATAGNAVDFPTVVDRMTDGDLDFICIGDGFTSNAGTLCKGEEEWWGLETADFSDFAIDTVTLYVAALDFEDPDPQGGVTSYSTLYFTVFGHPVVSTESISWGVVKSLYGSVYQSRR